PFRASLPLAPQRASLFEESFVHQLFYKTRVADVFEAQPRYLRNSWREEIEDELETLFRRIRNLLEHITFGVLPLTLDQVGVARSQIARRDSDRFSLTLLKESYPAHIAPDKTKHTVAVHNGIFVSSEYCRHGKFNAKLSEVNQLMETCAAADKCSAANDGGVYGPSA